MKKKFLKNILKEVVSLIALMIYIGTLVALPIVIADCPQGMIGYWNAEDDANDYFGTINGLLINGATSSPGGQVGFSFDFDGVDDHVEIPSIHSNGFNLGTGDFSFEAWINGGGSSTVCTILSHRTWANSIADGFIFGLYNGRLFVQLTGTNYLSNGQVVNVGGWYHVVVTRNDVDLVTFYVDGMQNGVTYTSHKSIDSDIAGPLFIGRDSPSDIYWNGQIDEVAIYDRALDEFEILCHYCLGLRNLGYCDEGCHKCAFSGTMCPSSSNSFFTPAIAIPKNNQYGFLLEFETAYDFYGDDYGTIWCYDPCNMEKLSTVDGQVDCPYETKQYYIPPGLFDDFIFIEFRCQITDPYSLGWYIDNIKLTNIDSVNPPIFDPILYVENFECYNIGDPLGGCWTIVGTEVNIERPINTIYLLDQPVGSPGSSCIPFIVGRITIEADTLSLCCCGDITRVTFEIYDSKGNLVIPPGIVTVNSAPYVYLWNTPAFGKFTIKIIATTGSCGTVSDQITVWKFF